jgi:hypothetical protein
MPSVWNPADLQSVRRQEWHATHYLRNNVTCGNYCRIELIPITDRFANQTSQLQPGAFPRLFVPLFCVQWPLQNTSRCVPWQKEI